MRIFSGVQPTGTLHIGNYLGSIQQWMNLINKDPKTEAIFFIVDLHAITIPQDPKVLKQKTYDVLATYLAAGLDPKKHILFVQSQNPDHASLAWIFNCIIPFGLMERMTQFKDKKEKMEQYKSIVSVGLFDYPALMAADILLYDPDMVPVGADQKQHVELTRDIAMRFNSLFGETFRIPEFQTNKETSEILDLQNPQKKMSKSDTDSAGRISLTDTPEEIMNKIKRSVTDSENMIKYDIEKKPGISNLITLLSSVTSKTIPDVEKEYQGQNYGTFKTAVGEAIIEFIRPLQERIKSYLSDLEELDKIVNNGNKRAQEISNKKIALVSNKMGLYYNGKEK